MDKQSPISSNAEMEKEGKDITDDKNLNEQHEDAASTDSDDTFEENSDSSQDDVDNATTIGVP